MTSRNAAGAAAGIAIAIFVALTWWRGMWLPLTLDEGYTRALTALPWPDVWEVLVHREMNGALHTALVRALGVEGPGVVAFRVPSLLATVAAGVLLWPLLRKVAAMPAAAVGMVFFAGNALVVEYATVGRTYALALALTVASTAMLVRAGDSGRRRDWTTYGLLIGLGVLAHLFVGIVAMAHLLWVLTGHRSTRRGWTWAVTPAVLVCLPVVLFIFVGGPSAGQLPDMPGLTASGYAEASMDLYIGQAGGQRLLQACLLVALIVAVSGCLRRLPHPLVRLAALMLVLPLAVGLAASVVANFFNARYLMVTLPGAALLVSAGVNAYRTPVRRVLVAALPVLLLAGYLRDQAQGPSWPAVVEMLHVRMGPGDVATTLVPFERHVFREYAQAAGLATAPAAPATGEAFLRASRYVPDRCPPTAVRTVYVVSTMTASYEQNIRVMAACAGREIHRIDTPFGFVYALD